MKKLFGSIAILLLTLIATALTEENDVFEEKNTYTNLEVVLDHQPIKNNRVVFATCNITNHRQTMNCTVFQKTFSSEAGFKTRLCQVTYQTNNDHEILKNQFQLKSLHEDHVLFMWSDQGKSKVQNLVFRTINFNDCGFSETRMTHDVPGKIYSGTDPFHVVSYGKSTFDLFFRNESLCGDKMCGQTYDLDGRVVNGPVASYIPTEYFQESTFVTPAKPGSPVKGHYVFSPNLRLVSSRGGLVKELPLVDPRGIDAVAVSTDSGLVGFCYTSKYNFNRISCYQFDDEGNAVSNHTVDLDFEPGRWMAMRNLGQGEILLATSKCQDDEWCQENFRLVSFSVMRIGEGRRQTRLFEGVDCNYAQDVRMDVAEVEGGGACAIFACYVGGAKSYVNVFGKCVHGD